MWRDNVWLGEPHVITVVDPELEFPINVTEPIELGRYVDTTVGYATKAYAIYIGGKDNIAHTVRKAYIGDENGVARLAYFGRFFKTDETIWTDAKVYAIYVGGEDGLAHAVKKAYTGFDSGVAKLSWTYHWV